MRSIRSRTVKAVRFCSPRTSALVVESCIYLNPAPTPVLVRVDGASGEAVIVAIQHCFLMDVCSDLLGLLQILDNPAHELPIIAIFQHEFAALKLLCLAGFRLGRGNLNRVFFVADLRETGIVSDNNRLCADGAETTRHGETTMHNTHDDVDALSHHTPLGSTSGKPRPPPPKKILPRAWT